MNQNRSTRNALLPHSFTVCNHRDLVPSECREPDSGRRAIARIVVRVRMAMKPVDKCCGES